MKATLCRHSPRSDSNFRFVVFQRRIAAVFTIDFATVDCSSCTIDPLRNVLCLLVDHVPVAAEVVPHAFPLTFWSHPLKICKRSVVGKRRLQGPAKEHCFGRMLHWRRPCSCAALCSRLLHARRRRHRRHDSNRNPHCRQKKTARPGNTTAVSSTTGGLWWIIAALQLELCSRSKGLGCHGCVALLKQEDRHLEKDPNE